MNPAGLLLGIAVAVTAIGIGVYVSRKALLQQGDKLFLIGDSISVGLRSHLQKLCEAEGIAFDAATVGGTTIQTWAGKAYPTPSVRTVAIIVLGTNDAAASDAYIRDVGKYIHQLHDKLVSTGYVVVWLAPGKPPSLPKAPQINQAINVAGLVDSFTVLDTDDANVAHTPNDVHFSPSGYASLAAWAFEKLTKP